MNNADTTVLVGAAAVVLALGEGVARVGGGAQLTQLAAFLEDALAAVVAL